MLHQLLLHVLYNYGAVKLCISTRSMLFLIHYLGSDFIVILSRLFRLLHWDCDSGGGRAIFEILSVHHSSDAQRLWAIYMPEVVGWCTSAKYIISTMLVIVKRVSRYKWAAIFMSL